VTRAAVYARKSTAQTGSPEARSTARQLENGRKFAEAHGWTVVRESIDEAVSGAVENRPGLRTVLSGAERREFEVLIISEAKTLARELTLGMATVKRLAQASVDT
jgi:DNA invertase Pin-like site-specific DNA recombinase